MGDFESRAARIIGDHLRRLRSALGWTLDDVVERAAAHGADISPSKLSRAERGRATLTAPSLSIVGSVLGTSLAQIEARIQALRERDETDLGSTDVDTLVEEGMDCVRRGDIAAALDRFEAAEDRLALLHRRDDPLLPEIWIKQAGCHTTMHRTILSSELARRALNHDHASPETRIRALLMEVVNRSLEDEFETARVFAGAAAERLADLPEATRAFGESVLADLHLRMHRWADAIPHLEHARDMYASLGNDYERTKVVIRLGYCLGMSTQPRGGKELIARSSGHARRRGYRDLVFVAERHLGEISLRENNTEEARKWLRAAAGGFRRLGRTPDEFVAVYYLWRGLSKAGKADAARRIQRELARLMRQLPHPIPESRRFVAELEAFQAARRTRR